MPEGDAGPAARLSVSATACAAGASLELTVHNTGTTDLWFGAEYVLQRRIEGAEEWEHVERVGGHLMVRYALAPGQRRSQTVEVPRNAAPGTYRVLKTLRAATNEKVRPTVEFELTPAT